MDGGAWRAAVHGVTEGRTRLSNFTFTFHFHALEKEMATHSSVRAWRISGTGEPGGAAVYEVAQSRTRLKWLSSSSSIWKTLMLGGIGGGRRRGRQRMSWLGGITDSMDMALGELRELVMPGVLRFMGSQRVGHDWATELNWTVYSFGSTPISLFPFDLLSPILSRFRDCQPCNPQLCSFSQFLSLLMSLLVTAAWMTSKYRFHLSWTLGLCVLLPFGDLCLIFYMTHETQYVLKHTICIFDNKLLGLPWQPSG